LLNISIPTTGAKEPSGIFEGTQATALSSKSTQLHLCHLHAVETCKKFILSVDFRKTARNFVM
jgi:dihydropteroate synthase